MVVNRNFTQGFIKFQTLHHQNSGAGVPKEKVGVEFQRKKWGWSSKGKSGAGVPKEKVGLEFQRKK
jgi:hypothetical protein